MFKKKLIPLEPNAMQLNKKPSKSKAPTKNKRTPLKLVPLLVAFGVIAAQAGQLAAANIDWRNNRIMPLEKVTVGPNDNYQAVIDTDNEFIFYTRYQNLLSGLVKQSLTTGITTNILPEDYDSKDPALAPDRSQLALTLFRFDALGDVCLLPLNEGKLHCITKSGSREWQPFWINNQQLGYLRQGANQTTTELVTHSLIDNTSQVLVTGQLSAPAASANGQWLVYNHEKTATKESGLYLYNQENQQEIGPIQLDLPGNSSFARFDNQQAFIYFSHYLNDTNNDQKIDAQDHSVLFRLPFEQALDTSKKHLPEQLTSVAQNCSFPALTDQKIYMTCAFEGSLDNYSMPITGQVPAQWQSQDINLAHAQASSYEERLLLLNTLRYREQQNSQAMLERLLSNHLALNEFTAASYYVKQLATAYQGDAELTEFFNNLAILLELQAKQSLQPQGIVTASFRQELQKEQQKLATTVKNPQNRTLFNAWINFLAKKPETSISTLTHINELTQSTNNSLHPLQTYLQLELANALAANQPAVQEVLFNRALNLEEISTEARLFYAFQWLKVLHQPNLNITPQVRQERLEQAANNSTDTRIQVLLRNEADLLKLIAATELNEERRYFTSMSQRLQPVKDDAQLRRLAHLRAIQMTGLAEKYDFMELISRHWLTHTQLSDPGFAQTAEYYASINLNRAYGSLAQHDNLTALNSFYALIRQTTDPEAIYQLINIGLQLDTSLQPRMELLLKQLIAEELVDKNDPVVMTTLELLKNPNPSVERLEELAKALQSYQPKGLNRGAADLLTGGLYHRLVLATQDGYSHNKNHYQQAHYHYMLGLDLAWNNHRTQAALLNNLGQLHLSVRNYGLASEFFALRLQQPFLSNEEELLTRWQLARSLFYSNRMKAASQQAEQALTISQQPTVNKENQLISLEKAGFYALQAKNFPLALKHYQTLLANHTLSGVNLTKTLFSQAYLNFKLGNNAPAETGFKEVLQQLPNLTAIPFKKGQLSSFSPERLKLQSYGFLAQLVEKPEEKLTWLNKRQQLLNDLKVNDLRYGFDEAGRLSQLIQTQLQTAVVLEQLNQHEQLASQMQSNVNSLKDWQKNGGSLIGQPVLHSIYNYLVLASSYPAAFAKEPKQLAALIQSIDKEWAVEPETPAYNQAQQLKLKLLEEGYRFRLQAQTAQQLEAKLEALKTGASWQGLAITRPDLHQELEKLAVGVQGLTTP